MNRRNCFFPLACCLMLCSILLCAQEKAGIDYVDPFIGTDFYGLTYPGVGLPFSLVHVSPDTHHEGWYHGAGYKYVDSNIMGFTHTHFMGGGKDVLLMPTVHPEIQIVPGPKDKPDEGYRSRFSHSSEKASPGYYCVRLEDDGVQVELTATRRVALHRYTFPKSEFARILLDLSSGRSRSTSMSELHITDDSTIEGFRGKGGPGCVYFVIRFNKPCLYYGTFDAKYQPPETGIGIFPYKNGESGNEIGAFFQYRTKAEEQILVKVALSYVSLEGARGNMEAELPHWDFEKVHQEARNAWSAELERVSIRGGSEEDRQKFYTAFYHSLLAENVSQDIDGRYMGMDRQVHQVKSGDFYPKFAAWDTYRSQHPWLVLTAPEHVPDMLRSIEAKVREYGWFPAQHSDNTYGQGMIGDHLVPIVVDAYLKGFRDFDAEYVFQAMKKKATEFPPPPIPRTAAREGLQDYMDRGYMAVDKDRESVSATLEYAYDDWCIAQMARALGKTADDTSFRTRSGNYKHLWDAESRFMRPRLANGQFLPSVPTPDRILETKTEGSHAWYAFFAPELIGRRPYRAYTESNAWPYVWCVQQDVPGLIQLMGGKDAFLQRLNDFFSMPPMEKGHKYIGTVGTIGQYVQGNQPSHHVAYLYNYAGQPWNTQNLVRFICDRLYRTGPGGLCGNEDMGSLSSWYLFSSIGFYPVTPGSQEYMIGSPSFAEASIRLPGGKSFTVKANNHSRQNLYIRSATLNGKPHDSCRIRHQDIVAGGVLLLEMDSAPNKQWGQALE